MNIQQQIQNIDELTFRFNQEFAAFNANQLNWKPNQKTWSIGQIINHLITINQSYYPIFSQLVTGTYTVPFTGYIAFLVKLFGREILKSVQPVSPKKVKTMPIWEPQISEISTDVLLEFENEQEKLKDWLLKCDEQISDDAVISSPANRFIVYKLSTCFEIIITHEERHLQQAMRLKELIPA
jgi:putative NIF3 family GTP cyclohydrolase 1 type 2